MLIQFHFSGNKKVLIATRESHHQANSHYLRTNGIKPQTKRLKFILLCHQHHESKFTNRQANKHTSLLTLQLFEQLRLDYFILHVVYFSLGGEIPCRGSDWIPEGGLG